MHKIVKLILIAFLFANNIVKCQDFILRIDAHVKTIYCKDIAINEGKVRYIDKTDDKEAVISIEDIYGINFFDNKPDELLIQSFGIDTVKCVIDSITKTRIFYHQENNLMKILDKGEVFYVHFGQFSDIPELDTYKEFFIGFYKNYLVKEAKLIKKDGTGIKFSDLVSLNEDRLDLKVMLDEVEVDTYIETNELKSLIYKQPILEWGITFNKTYILLDDGKFVEVIMNEINDKTIECTLYINDRLIDFQQNKNSIAGLFFYNYKKHKDQMLAGNYERSVYNEFKAHAVLDFAFGIGYLLSKDAPFTFYLNEQYIEEMRLGLTFDANATIFVSENFGLGIKYNQFAISNSFENIIGDKIKIRFFGGSLALKDFVYRDKLLVASSFSLGSLSEVDDAFFLDSDFTFKGKNIGLYFSIGMEYLITKHILFELKGGLMAGKIKTFDWLGYNIEIDKIVNLSRIDGMAGFKLKF